MIFEFVTIDSDVSFANRIVQNENIKQSKIANEKIFDQTNDEFSLHCFVFFVIDSTRCSICVFANMKFSKSIFKYRNWRWFSNDIVCRDVWCDSVFWFFLFQIFISSSLSFTIDDDRTDLCDQNRFRTRWMTCRWTKSDLNVKQKRQTKKWRDRCSKMLSELAWIRSRWTTQSVLND